MIIATAADGGDGGRPGRTWRVKRPPARPAINDGTRHAANEQPASSVQNALTFTPSPSGRPTRNWP